MQLPESYWDDVNRYYGEIVADLPVSHEGPALFNYDRVGYSWPAQEEDIQARVLRKTHHILGTIALTHHYLGLSRTEHDTTLTHWIRFDPTRNQIVRVQDDNYSTLRQATLLEDMQFLRERSKMAKRIAILTPTAEDYELLHDELQRGAQFRAYDISGEE